mmetsp:Transcript_24261/g.47709  ORF Transcript_24261/g.47709 Transcript_24261/m.47709 type:complete len:90 (+) Transcript_24261:211-480(+)
MALLLEMLGFVTIECFVAEFTYQWVTSADIFVGLPLFICIELFTCTAKIVLAIFFSGQGSSASAVALAAVLEKVGKSNQYLAWLHLEVG